MCVCLHFQFIFPYFANIEICVCFASNIFFTLIKFKLESSRYDDLTIYFSKSVSTKTQTNITLFFKIFFLNTYCR